MVGILSVPTHRATLSRSVTLFRSFLTEQTDPDGFYQTLADDSVRQLAAHTSLNGRTMVDVGGGPGYFSDAFRAAGAYYLGVDPDVGELSARGTPGENMVRASGTMRRQPPASPGTRTIGSPSPIRIPEIRPRPAYE